MILRDESKEEAAYKLFRHIAAVERKAIEREEIRQGEVPASREWILDTYLECLRRVEATRHGEAATPNGADTVIAATPALPMASPVNQLVMHGNDTSSGQPLDKWILDYCESDSYKERRHSYPRGTKPGDGRTCKRCGWR